MRRWLAALALCTLPALASAQETAALLADSVYVGQDEVLVAEGDVQISYGNYVLTADRITYDQAADKIRVTGQLALSDGDGTAIVAEYADLDADFRNGVLRSARLVLERQLQLAATEIARVDDRYTQLTNVVTSACEICAADPRPLWEIRARRVTYDEEEEQLYFDGAQIRALGLPIFYVPRLRLPSPDNARSSGLLPPRLVSNSELGFGIKLPYYQTLGPYADLTLRPYLSAKTGTLEARYRQNLTFGAINIAGAISRDSILPDDTRHFVFADAAFALPADYLLTIQLQNVSDITYLTQYDYSDRTLLTDEVKLSRVDRDRFFRASFTDYETLRSVELPIRDRLPASVTDFYSERRLTNAYGGTLTLGADATILTRESAVNPIGRDVAEIGGFAEYFRRRTLDSGLVWSNRARVTGGTYKVRDDAFFDDVFRAAAGVSTELRLPLERTGANGSHHLLEPVVSLAWSEASDRVPNEDSTLVEFDEGNLYALSRFPGDDRVEEGLRTNLGIGYTGRFANGAGVGLTFGRILRHSPDRDFTDASGLAGTASDWLAALSLDLDRFDLTARTLVSSEFEPTKVETIADWRAARYGLSGSYLFLTAEPMENRPDDTHEVNLAGDIRLGRHWLFSAEGRYDLTTPGIDSAELGLTYRTECIEIGLTAERTYYRRQQLDPVSSVSFQLALLGFGQGSVDESYRTQCRG